MQSSCLMFLDILACTEAGGYWTLVPLPRPFRAASDHARFSP